MKVSVYISLVNIPEDSLEEEVEKIRCKLYEVFKDMEDFSPIFVFRTFS